MNLQDAIGALRYLPDDAEITISVRTADLRVALERKAGGPELMTTKQAAATLGYTARQWQRWAEAGEIDGAYQDAEGGPWHLPRPACEAVIRLRQKRGATRTVQRTASRSGRPSPSSAKVPRGPWKAQARRAAEGQHTPPVDAERREADHPDVVSLDRARHAR